MPNKMCNSKQKVIIGIQLLLATTVLGEEYCSDETFSPKCRNNEVIVMQQAKYGRMTVGRCVSVNVGSCSEDVLPSMDTICSGRFNCSIGIPSSALNELVPCTKEYTPYLEASFICQSVYHPQTCSQHHPVQVTPLDTVLASEITRKTGCGLPENPWTLQAKPGQKISLSLVQFVGEKSSKCAVRFGYIVDVEDSQMVDICLESSREQQVYTSRGNLIQIVLQQSVLEKHSFLIKVKAIGCPDFIPPNNAWMRKEDTRITIGCHGSNKQWTLHCSGSRWIGHIDSCPQDNIFTGAVMSHQQQKMSTVIAVTLICSTTAVICTVSATLIIVFFYFKKYKLKRKSDSDYYTSGPPNLDQNLQLSNGSILTIRSKRPQNTLHRLDSSQRGTLRAGGTLNAGGTLLGQFIVPHQADDNNFLEEVIYDDPANLDRTNVEYVNQVPSQDTATNNSLQYTKLQKR